MATENLTEMEKVQREIEQAEKRRKKLLEQLQRNSRRINKAKEKRKSAFPKEIDKRLKEKVGLELVNLDLNKVVELLVDHIDEIKKDDAVEVDDENIISVSESEMNADQKDETMEEEHPPKSESDAEMNAEPESESESMRPNLFEANAATDVKLETKFEPRAKPEPKFKTADASKTEANGSRSSMPLHQTEKKADEEASRYFPGEDESLSESEKAARQGESSRYFSDEDDEQTSVWGS